MSNIDFTACGNDETGMSGFERSALADNITQTMNAILDDFSLADMGSSDLEPSWLS